MFLKGMRLFGRHFHWIIRWWRGCFFLCSTLERHPPPFLLASLLWIDSLDEGGQSRYRFHSSASSPCIASTDNEFLGSLSTLGWLIILVARSWPVLSDESLIIRSWFFCFVKLRSLFCFHWNIVRPFADMLSRDERDYFYKEISHFVAYFWLS